MITRDQAIRGGTFHFTAAESQVGSHGWARVESWRSNGQCKTWKTRPSEFRLPIKHGLYDYSYLTEVNAEGFHHEDDCPLNDS
jgi:D-hexose-6-phosphate mutarotase